MLNACKRVLVQYADKAGPDQPADVYWLLTESNDTIVYVDELRIFKSDYMDAHADLNRHCLQIV